MCGAYWRAALIKFFVPDAALIRVNTVIGIVRGGPVIFVTFSTVQRGIPVDPFSKVPKTFRARKAVPKTPTHSFCKAGLFTFCKGEKN